MFPRYHTGAQYGNFNIRRLRPNEKFWHRSIDGEWEFRTNRQGYRNDFDFSYEKPVGVYRILVLGDSHTQGFEVNQEETYSSIIQISLSEAGIASEVMNTGISGFGSAEELAYLEAEGLNYDPDFVVLGFYANDIEDNIKAGLYKLDDGNNLIVAKYSHLPGVKIQNFIYRFPFTKWLGENSYLYSIAFNGIWELAKRALANTRTVKLTEYAVSTRQDYLEYEINLATALILRMQKLSASSGAHFIFVDIPEKDGLDTIRNSVPRQIKANILDNVDDFVDLAQVLATQHGRKLVHVPHGHNHISAYSHRVLGKEIARLIEKQIQLSHSARAQFFGYN